MIHEHRGEREAAAQAGEADFLRAGRERPSRAAALARAVRLRCPRCGAQPLFHGLVMNASCASCGLKYEREPGYFLGSIYINYGLTALSTTAAFLVLRFGWSWPMSWVVPPLLAWCILFPIWFHRYARAYWLAMDLHFDPPETADEQLPRSAP